jgi:hypothetical protein
MELRADLEEAKEELKELRNNERYDRRIQPIINVIRERTKRGFEEDALQRINRVYNGL